MKSDYYWDSKKSLQSERITANIRNIGILLGPLAIIQARPKSFRYFAFSLENMAKRKTSVTLPEAGQVFAFPLEDGRYGACRVLRSASEDEVKELGERCVLVSCSTWIGDSIPNAPNEQMRETLCLTHHSWKGQPELFWVSKAVPVSFVSIGFLVSTTEEQKLECYSLAGWESCAIQVLAQWRWDHDREKQLAHEAVEQAALVAKRAANQQLIDAERNAMTLSKLSKHKFFEDWDDYPSAKAIRASRRIMKETIKSLIELGEKASEAERLQVLQSCIEEFNQLNSSLDDFIETTVREDICDEFELIVLASGLGHLKDLADQWRDW